jgi:2-polyprenyl-3-methyl-5-hydroxy-6-metoxy-1,4-benzoquinol methylase
MDDPALDPAEHARALAGLARINRWTGSAACLQPAIFAEARTHHRPVRVLDIATGSGDIPVTLARSASRAGLPIQFDGCDLSPTAVDQATARAQSANVPCRFFRHDLLRDPLPPGYDIVTASLFLHHLTDDDAVRVLMSMKQAAGRMVLVSDLSRGRFNRALVWLGCRLLSRSPVVHFDGPVSVSAAFTPNEAADLAARAGMTGAHVSACFPCRWLFTWRTPA